MRGWGRAPTYQYMKAITPGKQNVEMSSLEKVVTK